MLRRNVIFIAGAILACLSQVVLFIVFLGFMQTGLAVLVMSLLFVILIVFGSIMMFIGIAIEKHPIKYRPPAEISQTFNLIYRICDVVIFFIAVISAIIFISIFYSHDWQIISHWSQILVIPHFPIIIQTTFVMEKYIKTTPDSKNMALFWLFRIFIVSWFVLAFILLLINSLFPDGLLSQAVVGLFFAGCFCIIPLAIMSAVLTAKQKNGIRFGLVGFYTILSSLALLMITNIHAT